MVTEKPKKSLDGFAWCDALYLWKKGEPNRLVALLRDATKPVPENARAFLADVVDGTAKLPARNARIKLDHDAKLDLGHAVDALAQGLALGVFSPKVARHYRAVFIADLARKTGAKTTVIARQWGKAWRESYASWSRFAADHEKLKEELKREKQGYTSRIHRIR